MQNLRCKHQRQPNGKQGKEKSDAHFDCNHLADIFYIADSPVLGYINTRAAVNPKTDNGEYKVCLLYTSDLEKKKVICGYHTIINWEKTNKDKVMALIEVDVTPERDFGYDRVAKNIYRYPEVDTMYLMSGKSEFIVIIYGRTMQEISNFVGAKLATTENVVSTSTFFVLKEYKVNGIVLDEEEKPSERLVVTP